MKAIQVLNTVPTFGPNHTQIIGYFDNLVEAKKFVNNIPNRQKSFTRICEGGIVKRFISYTYKKVVIWN